MMLQRESQFGATVWLAWICSGSGLPQANSVQLKKYMGKIRAFTFSMFIFRTKFFLGQG